MTLLAAAPRVLALAAQEADGPSVSPGVIGFLVTLALVLACIPLFRSMTGKIRGVTYRDAGDAWDAGQGSGRASDAGPDAGPQPGHDAGPDVASPVAAPAEDVAGGPVPPAPEA